MREPVVTVSAGRIATLAGEFSRSPAYAGLADALRLLIAEGRLGIGVRLPSERELTAALGVSRTTVTRAYVRLRESGYAHARRGAGTFTQVPGGRTQVHDRSLLPRDAPGLDPDLIDINCAAPSAPPGLSAAYTEALDLLPAYLRGQGYYPLGVPALQAEIAARYDAQGLPTDPDQIMVTSGALAAGAIVAQALSRPGARTLVESPTYPNATDALRRAGARLVPAPVDPDGWDLASIADIAGRSRATFAYLIPDFQNPTGLLMAEAEREELATRLRRAGVRPVIDEAHRDLVLSIPGAMPGTMPRPFAVWEPDAVSIGSASKSHWGGLRLGWLRAPAALMPELVKARIALDLGAPVYEQLVLTRLLQAHPDVLAGNRDRLRRQRDALAGAVRNRLPQWRFRLPEGGLALWCRLPEPLALPLAARAEQRGVVFATGPMFAVEGGLGSFVRLPWTRDEADLVEAVERIAGAWADVAGGMRTRRAPGRVLIA